MADGMIHRPLTIRHAVAILILALAWRMRHPIRKVDL